MVDATTENHVVTQTVAKDPGTTEILARYKTISDPIGTVSSAGSLLTSSARGTVNGTNAAGEQPMGDVIADGDLRGSPSERLRRHGRCVHERRRCAGEPALQPDQWWRATGRGHLR